MINIREYLQETYQARPAGRLYPAILTGKRGQKTPLSRRLAVDLDTESAKAEDVVYFMVVNGELKYIGYTASSLQVRINNYNSGRFGTAGGTNKRLFKAVVEGDLQVELLYTKIDTVKRFGLTVSLTRSLEYALIQKHNPEWNKKIR
jgi:hypothetical protein